MKLDPSLRDFQSNIDTAVKQCAGDLYLSQEAGRDDSALFRVLEAYFQSMVFLGQDIEKRKNSEIHDFKGYC